MAAQLVPVLEPAALWYAVYVRSRHEKVVETALKGKGYPAFSPTYRVRRRRSGRTVETVVPLFPSYVFCHFDATQRLPILQSPGVVFVVSSGDSPQPVDEREINSLQSVIASGRQVRPWPFLKEGQRVRIQAGPLTGTQGILVGSKNEARLVVSVSLLQRSVSVEVDVETVVPEF